MLYKLFLSKKGFTMVEILIVVLVLGILTAIAVPVFSLSLKKQRQDDCRNQRLVIETAVQQAMYGMIDNGRKQDKINIALWADGANKIQYNPNGQIKFNLDESYNYTYYTPLNESLTLGQIRGGYNPDYSKESCELTGKYLKKQRLENVAFYTYLDNMEIPVCPFADDTNSQGYYYCIFADGTVCCTCPDCNEID